jgi:hypothetical protein
MAHWTYFNPQNGSFQLSMEAVLSENLNGTCISV